MTTTTVDKKTKKAAEAERNAKLLENAKIGTFALETQDPEYVKLVKDFIDFRKMKNQVDALEKDLNERVKDTMVSHGVSVIRTPVGDILAKACSRQGLDESKVPQEILEAAKKLLEFTQIQVFPKDQTGRFLPLTS